MATNPKRDKKAFFRTLSVSVPASVDRKKIINILNPLRMTEIRILIDKIATVASIFSRTECFDLRNFNEHYGIASYLG